MSIFTPVNQNRLTNVAYVRLKKGGKHFEIACYKNKVQAWRNKTETNIDEVLQTSMVFTNVSRGQIAKKEDLVKVFDTENLEEICKIILEKGDLQISEKERQNYLQNTFKDIATIISNKCINKDTNKPFPATMIENAMRELHFSVNPKKNAKQQALEVIKKLKTKLNIERVQMKVLITLSDIQDKAEEKVLQLENTKLLSKNIGGNQSKLVLLNFILKEILIDPGHLRELNEIIQKETDHHGTLEILNVMEFDHKNINN